MSFHLLKSFFYLMTTWWFYLLVTIYLFIYFWQVIIVYMGLLVVKKLPADAGNIRDVSSIPGSGRSPGEGNGNRLQYSCLENPMDRRAQQAMVHSVAKNQTQLKWLSTHAHIIVHTASQQLYCLSISIPLLQRRKPRVDTASLENDQRSLWDLN